MHGRSRTTWLALGAGALVVLGALAGWRAVVLQERAYEAREHLVAARAALSDTAATGGPESPTSALGQTQWISACAEATAAADSLRDVNGQLQMVMPLVGALENLPGIGARTRTQTDTLQAGTQLATAAVSLCDGLGPLSTLLSGGSAVGGPQSAREVMLALANASPRLAEATQRLEQLQLSLNDIRDVDMEPGNRLAMASLRERLPEVVKTLRDGRVLLGLLGANGPRRYLLVSQNPDELRATGGFIGSAGVIEASAGAIKLAEYGTSRRYDTPPDWRAVPPPEFQVYLGRNSWNLAGANWWVSYPDVARQLRYFYSLSHPADTVDGVIALDQFGLQRLLDVLGPVDVPEYGELVSAANLQARLDHHVHAGDPGDETGRKQFTAALSAAVLQSVLTAPPGALPGVVKAVRQALDQQHLLVWVLDPEAAQLFATRHWDGALLPAAGDALMLLDTEIGATKQSQAVTREANYSVTLGDGQRPRASLDLVYTNTARPEQRPEVNFVPDYQTYLRALVPPTAELVSSSGFAGPVSVGDECGRRVFAGQISIPEKAAKRVRLEYQLPPSVTSNGYDLLVQQQPGVPPGSVSVAVSAAGGAIARADLASAPGQHGHWRLDTSAGPALQAEPLAQAAPGGCPLPTVEARPLTPPVSLQVQSLEVDARVVDLGVAEDGEMEAPPTPDVVGWYRMSSRPGEPGNSVMSGHVDWGHNRAVFWGLRKLRPGDPINVRGSDGVVHTYTVEWNTSFPWKTAPIERIVGPSSDSVLTLITCDGVYDPRTGVYSERRVVRARLTD